MEKFLIIINCYQTWEMNVKDCEIYHKINLSHNKVINPRKLEIKFQKI